MKKILIILFCLLISCRPHTHINNNAVTSVSAQNKTIITTVNFDTSQFHIDTVKLINLKHLPASNLYDLHCKMCHGVYGKGDGVKAIITHKGEICPYDLSKVTKTDKEIYYIVLNGINKMPDQHELDSNNVWLIVIYIKKFKI